MRKKTRLFNLVEFIERASLHTCIKTTRKVRECFLCEQAIEVRQQYYTDHIVFGHKYCVDTYQIEGMDIGLKKLLDERNALLQTNVALARENEKLKTDLASTTEEVQHLRKEVDPLKDAMRQIKDIAGNVPWRRTV
jgi:hypothetical protein